MNRSTVYVQYGDGSKPKGKKVVLGFSGGMTKPAYTDNNGVAIVEHSSTGTATVYVSGKSYGTFRAPGQYSVYLS